MINSSGLEGSPVKFKQAQLFKLDEKSPVSVLIFQFNFLSHLLSVIPRSLLFAPFCSLLRFFQYLISCYPFLYYSAMNMDRFEKGPREILNPEIQKVRATLEQQPARCSKRRRQRFISSQAWSATPKLYNVLRLCHLSPLCWLLWVTVFISSFLRTCWCWRNRRYERIKYL